MHSPPLSLLFSLSSCFLSPFILSFALLVTLLYCTSFVLSPSFPGEGSNNEHRSSIMDHEPPLSLAVATLRKRTRQRGGRRRRGGGGKKESRKGGIGCFDVSFVDVKETKTLLVDVGAVAKEACDRAKENGIVCAVCGLKKAVCHRKEFEGSAVAVFVQSRQKELMQQQYLDHAAVVQSVKHVDCHLQRCGIFLFVFHIPVRVQSI